MELVYFVLVLASLLVHSQTTVSTPETPKVGKFPSGISPIQRAGPSSNQRLGSSELAYLQARKSKVFCSTWKSYFADVHHSKVHLPDYISRTLNGHCKNMPDMGITTSGEGYRAEVFGAGKNSTSAGIRTGGLMQTAACLSRFFGGLWLITSLHPLSKPTSHSSRVV